MNIEEINALTIKLLKIEEQLEDLLEKIKSSREEVNILLTKWRVENASNLERNKHTKRLN